MRCMHLFELEDQPWFPATLRDAGTGYISAVDEIIEGDWFRHQRGIYFKVTQT